MPAISLLKLNESIARIRSLVDDPADLCAYITSFFETYSDQTFHIGDKSVLDSRLPSYRIPPVITKKLEREFIRISQETPEKAFRLVQALWDERHFENRFLACVTLGNLSSPFFEKVLSKINDYLSEGVSPYFVETFLRTSSETIRKENPALWCLHAESWLNNHALRWKSYGLTAYNLLLSDNSYKDLPNLMHGLLPYLNMPHPLLVSEGISLFQRLFQSFPEEIDFYLEDILDSPPNPERDMLLRKSLSQHNPEKYLLIRSRISKT